jgi:hypothetical protein
MTLDELVNFREKARGEQTRRQICAEVVVATVGQTADLKRLTSTPTKECGVYLNLWFRLALVLRLSLKFGFPLDA